MIAAKLPTPRLLASSPNDEPIRVMVCDDSAVIRGAVTRMLEADPAIRVVSRPANGQAALEELRRQAVDIIILDIEMPVMNGLTALPLLLAAEPSLRVIMASTLTTRGADIAWRALRMGAADYIPKPSTAAIQDDSFRRELLAKVRGLARLRRAPPPLIAVGTGSASCSPGIALRPAARVRPDLLAIGSSTGGPQALFTLVHSLGRNLPVPVVLTQHMPRSFTPILADHLARLGGMPCAEARDGERLEAGHIYLAPGDQHFCIDHIAAGLQARLSAAPAENFCRPSVDPMLRSATLACGGRVLMVMLTGMGHDGLASTRDLIEAGGTAIAQDEATSIVWGMPGAIAQSGLCHAVLPLPGIAAKLHQLLGVTGR